MITRIVIPQLFENMEEATIGTWLKNEGDAITRGDALCELITEKSTFDLEAEADGVLRRIVTAEKSIVPVHFIIGLIGEPDDELPDVETENAALQSSVGKQEEKAEESTLRVPSPDQNVSVPKPKLAAVAATGGAGGGRIRATPAARRAAKELGVEIEAVAAAHPGKVLSEDDVRNFKG